ncbi:hypothetical protein [Faecalicatena contorta]|uniref:Uncharacterized protein n=1 Tax=Faecalicatena contorta TaxID=39482 RepID=A0A315ZXD3_9FIRM|nr:hypothetical protein [Faecalicatena contorta]PWJ50145.1 hypothetical protein A8805_105241 [Faecalicatena contorta]SUQ14266.1 hypothetical protein SAMN05216529_105241 [Faecalicatena contorta]
MKCVRYIAAIMLSVLYYIVFCWIMGCDCGDPWKKLIEWAKK